MRIRLDQSQRQLPPIRSLVTFDKIRERRGEIAHLQVAAPAQFMRYVCGNVIRPTLGSVEGHDPDRVAVLAGEQVLNDSL